MPVIPLDDSVRFVVVGTEEELALEGFESWRSAPKFS
jgi:hypothetical protein